MKSDIISSRVYEKAANLNNILDGIKPNSVIVYTYGVWDLFHPGHIRLLKRAKNLGDFLIVGTVADSPVKELKGDLRPVQTQLDRATIIGSLRFVDAVILQPQYDPSEIINDLSRLDILTKGDDWDYIPGTEAIEEKGGKLVLLGYSEGFSTTDLVNKILK
tara:strand:+ start:2135 stop:2617 length:483 start_codon:yes stop_codon:yes gene_type:complete